MYQKIYELLNARGRVKTAVILNGPFAGCKCIVTDGKCMPLEEEEADVDRIDKDRADKGRANVGMADADKAGIDRPDWESYEAELCACGETGMVKIGDTDIFVEMYLKNPHLILLGGGHVSCPVAHIAKMLGFQVTVMDDRAEFVTSERFPEADELILGSFEELSEKIPAYENAYYVIVTRGHAGDSLCARQILTRPYAYLGMIGSRTKVKLTREKLLEEGFSAEKLDTIHAPIGLPIGGQTPEEIAVSIIAEMVQEKNRHYAAYSDEKVEQAVRGGKQGVMLTIVEKSGSSPRGVGSKMFVDEEGNTYGSIGGGSVEYEAVRHAVKLRDTEMEDTGMKDTEMEDTGMKDTGMKDFQVVHYNLSVSDKRNLGMICGGKVGVLFERVRENRE